MVPMSRSTETGRIRLWEKVKLTRCPQLGMPKRSREEDIEFKKCQFRPEQSTIPDARRAAELKALKETEDYVAALNSWQKDRYMNVRDYAEFEPMPSRVSVFQQDMYNHGRRPGDYMNDDEILRRLQSDWVKRKYRWEQYRQAHSSSGSDSMDMS